jgi:O-antigen ligase
VAASAATTQRRRLLIMAFLLTGSLAISIYAQVHHVQMGGGILSQRLVVGFNAMTSGALFMMAILIAFGFLIVPGIGRWWKLIIGIAILPVVLGLLMTMTRSAQLGLLAGMGIILLLAKPRIFWIYLGVLLVAMVVLAIFGEHLMSAKMWSRVNPQYIMGGNNTVYRLDMWRGGWEIVKAHPITGVGDRGLMEISPDYYTSAYEQYFGHLHSNIVQMAVIWGIPGLILGQAFTWAGLWYLIKRWRTLRRRTGSISHTPVQSAWVLAAVGVWVSFYIAGFTEWYFGDAESMLIYLAILGCALGPGDSEDLEPA